MQDDDSASTRLDSSRFRDVLGHFPTGVVVVTAMVDDGPLGMVVGSFTSVSLEPPLVAFLPARSSATFARLRDAYVFCVNILSAQQEDLCRRLASKSMDIFASYPWDKSPGGAPILLDAVAWIECSFESIIEAGDHYVVLGRVADLTVVRPELPLIFFQGGYGVFAPRSLVSGEADIYARMAPVNAARPVMERLSADLGLVCRALLLTGNEQRLVASASPPNWTGLSLPLGTRFPFVPPWGMPFVAWETEDKVREWLDRSPEPLSEERVAAIHHSLRQIRETGVSVSRRFEMHEEVDAVLRRIGHFGMTPKLSRQLVDTITGTHAHQFMTDEPTQPVRSLSAPVFGPDGSVEWLLVLFGIRADSPEDVARLIGRLRRTTDQLSGKLGGGHPR